MRSWGPGRVIEDELIADVELMESPDIDIKSILGKKKRKESKRWREERRGVWYGTDELTGGCVSGNTAHFQT